MKLSSYNLSNFDVDSLKQKCSENVAIVFHRSVRFIVLNHMQQRPHISDEFWTMQKEEANCFNGTSATAGQIYGIMKTVFKYK